MYEFWHFTVPKGVTKIDVFCVGGGSAGNGNCAAAFIGASGGYGGTTKTVKSISVTPEQSIAVTIGAGGIFNGDYKAVIGSDTSIGGYTAKGALNGFNSWYSAVKYYVGSGCGDGGKDGTYNYANYELDGKNGGSDGGDGVGTTASSVYGYGCSKTTRYFGETNGTLYAGGGGGGSGSPHDTSYSPIGGSGGSGGGGNGRSAGQDYSSYYAVPDNGRTNTGGGGGGGSYNRSGGNGGSGIAIIRWSEQ